MKEQTQMDDKYMKKSHNKKIKIKTTLRYNFEPIKLVREH